MLGITPMASVYNPKVNQDVCQFHVMINKYATKGMVPRPIPWQILNIDMARALFCMNQLLTDVDVPNSSGLANTALPGT